MTIPLIQVDAFTDRAFGGNPAAVCLLDAPPTDAWMANVAAEMNVSETAYCWPEGDDGAYRLRWFSPTVEVPLCGHATLATAHVLYEEKIVAADDAIAFDTLSGRLLARPAGELIELDFPALPVTPVPATEAAALVAALGSTPVAVGVGREKALVEMSDEAAVRAVTPDLAALAALPYQGLIVTAAADGPDLDYVLRFFAPNAGIDEDPVTGSAQCSAGPYWAERTGRDELAVAQLSQRGGLLRVTVRGDRVAVAGQAVTVLRGTLVGGMPG